MALGILLSGLLLLTPACSTGGGGAEESAPAAVAGGSPSIIDLVKKDIKRGDDVTVTEKNGNVHRLKVSKIDDDGIHGRDARKKRVTIPFDDFQSLAVKRGVIRESTPHRRGSGDREWVGTAGKVIIGAGLGYLILYGGVLAIGEGVGEALADAFVP